MNHPSTLQNEIPLQRDFKGFNVSEIVKGGSLGHGTVVFSGFDIDLVIYSRGMWKELVEY